MGGSRLNKTGDATLGGDEGRLSGKSAEPALLARSQWRRSPLSTGSSCGVLADHWRARPSPRRVRRNHRVETAMAAPITNIVTPVFNSTKLPMDWLNRNHNPRAALATNTKVHSREIRRKKRCTQGRLKRAGSRGQKSLARRSAIGFPAGTETRKAAATRKVPTV